MENQVGTAGSPILNVLERNELMNVLVIVTRYFGGILLGFGARLAKGCNAGALYSSMATFSLSGWVFLIAMTLGAIACLKLLAGKMSMVPNRCEIFGKDI